MFHRVFELNWIPQKNQDHGIGGEAVPLRSPRAEPRLHRRRNPLGVQEARLATPP